MKSQEETLLRRQVIEAGVAGAALLALPEGCGSSSTPPTPDASKDATTMDAAAKAQVGTVLGEVRGALLRRYGEGGVEQGFFGHGAVPFAAAGSCMSAKSQSKSA